MQLENILIASHGDLNTQIAQRLFACNYKPHQLVMTTLPDKDNAGFFEFCHSHDIEYAEVSNSGDLAGLLVDKKFDLGICVGGFNFLVPQTLLDKIKHGIINLHTGDSNRYRGRWMVSWAILNGETEYGFTWHYMNQEFDTGNILLQNLFRINENDTAFSMNHNVIANGIFQLPLVLRLVGTVGTPVYSKGQYYNKSVPHNGIIDPSWHEDYVKKFIRAMYHPPHRSAMVMSKHGTYVEVDTFEEYQRRSEQWR